MNEWEIFYKEYITNPKNKAKIYSWCDKVQYHVYDIYLEQWLCSRGFLIKRVEHERKES